MKFFALIAVLASLKSDYQHFMKADFWDLSVEDGGTATVYVTGKFVKAPIKVQAHAAITVCRVIRAQGDHSADNCYFTLSGFGDVATVMPDDSVIFEGEYISSMTALREAR
jgi:hypothetical protein